MRTNLGRVALATSMILGFAGVARSEPPPPAMGVSPWQVIPNTCQTSRTTTRVDGPYERTTVADFAACQTPVRRIIDRARVDLPAMRDEPMRHRFRIDGDF